MLFKKTTMEPLWIHGFIVVPDGRILVERLSIGKFPAAWCASVGRLSYRLQEARDMLNTITMRRFGLDLKDANAEVTLLLTHTWPIEQILHVQSMFTKMEIYRIKLFENATISMKRSSDIMALDFKELVDHVARSKYEDTSITAINIVDAMNVSF